MSQRVVGYEGEGRHRRPVYADEGPASAAIALSPVDSIGQLNASAVRGIGERLTGGAGPIERREASVAQREAWAADGPPVRPSIEDIPVSSPWRSPRSVAAAADHEAARRPPPREEEPAVTEPAQDPIIDVEPEPSAFAMLALAAERADAAVDDFARARQARDEALEELEAAAARLGFTMRPVSPAEIRHERLLVDPLVGPTVVDALVAGGFDVLVHAANPEVGESSTPALEDALTRQALLAEDEVTVAADQGDDIVPIELQREIPGYKSNTSPIGGGPAVDDGQLTPFQRRLLDATIRNAGDRTAVASELGVLRESVDGTLERIGKKGLLPATLIPLLPARFARYQGV